jgi:multisubunit Na+/H+ antiporter MnhG subunit
MNKGTSKEIIKEGIRVLPELLWILVIGLFLIEIFSKRFSEEIVTAIVTIFLIASVILLAYYRARKKQKREEENE